MGCGDGFCALCLCLLDGALVVCSRTCLWQGIWRLAHVCKLFEGIRGVGDDNLFIGYKVGQLAHTV